MSEKFNLSSELALYVNRGGRLSVYDHEGLAGMVNPENAYALAKAIIAAIKQAEQEKVKRQDQGG